MNRIQLSFLLSFILFSSCGLFKSDPQAPINEPVIAAEKAEEQAFIVEVVSDLRAKKPNALHERFPSLFLARAISGSKGAEMSDDEIRFQLLDPLKERFDANWHGLIQGMDNNEVNSKSLTYVSHTVEYSGDPAKNPNAISIVVSSEKNGVKSTHEVPFSFLEYNGRWYVFELLRTEGVFDPQ